MMAIYNPISIFIQRDSWLPGWEQGEGRVSESAALQIDYVKVWKMQSVEQ